MALFKSRKETQDTPSGAVAEDTVESLRRRARQRLIGAAVLVAAGVIGFPILFDSQPRPVPVDIPVLIPDREKARNTPVNQPEAAAVPAKAAASAEATAAPTAAVAEPAGTPPTTPAPVSSGLGPREEVVATATPKAEPAKPEPAKADAAKPEPAKADASKADEAARAKALLEGKADPSKGATDLPARFVVQVGAYAEADKAREVRQQLERAGLKTYTHVAETKDGRRIRVRVGPFANKAEAERVSQKVKGMGLPVAILAL